MCGLTGFLTTGTRNVGALDRGKYLRQTLIVDSLRGFHSTGVFYSRLDPAKAGAGWAKACEQGAEFVNSKNYRAIEKDIGEMRFAVGHNRWATMGGTDDVACAHPFQESDITLVHNGTLDYDGGLITTMDMLGVEVDSHAICHNLSFHDTKEVLEKLDGAFCLIWHDKRDDSLNFVRNSERPLTLWMPTANYLDTIYFGSERKMMEWIMSRNSIASVSGDYVDLPTGELWKFLPGSLSPIVEKLDLAPTYTYWNNRQYYQGGNYGKKPQGGSVISGNQSQESKPHIKLYANKLSSTVNGHLNKFGFDQNDRLPFLPISNSGKAIIGTVENMDMAAIVIGEDHTQCSDNWDRRWCLRPVGVRSVRNEATGKDEDVVIGKIISWNYIETMFNYGDGWINDNLSDDDDSIPFPTDPKPVGANELFKVGVSEMGTRERWYNVTHKGCAMCNIKPSVHLNAELVWLDDGSGSFLCSPCANSNHITA